MGEGGDQFDGFALAEDGGIIRSTEKKLFEVGERSGVCTEGGGQRKEG